VNALGLTLEPVPTGLVPLPANLLAIRRIDAVHPQLAASLGLDPEQHHAAGLVTCDQDDALYVALDHATKFAEVDVVFGKSFYAGSKHASGPLSGEVLGILAGADMEAVVEGLWALREGLRDGIHFHTFGGSAGEGLSPPAFFARVISETGRSLAPQAGIEPGRPMAYLIAPPLEATIAVDAALKAADVTLAKFLPPPSETNFAGAYLTGELADLEAAAVAFVAAIRDVVQSPTSGVRRPDRLRR